MVNPVWDFFFQRWRNSGGFQFLENILSPQSNADSNHMKQWGICCLGWATLKGFLPFCLLCNFAEEVLLLLEFGSVKTSQWQGYSLKKASNQGFLPLDPAGMRLEQPSWMTACLWDVFTGNSETPHVNICSKGASSGTRHPKLHGTEREQLWGFLQCFSSWKKFSSLRGI